MAETSITEAFPPGLVAAFEPPVPGRLVRFGRFLPGVATTAEQIERFAAYWRGLALEAIGAIDATEAIGTDEPVLVALGDSLAQGIGATGPENGYVGLVRRHLAGDQAMPPVLNLSRSGATIADVLEVQLPALAASGLTAGLVVCTVGSNDLVRSARLLQTRRSLRRLLAALPSGAVMATLPARGSLAAKNLNRHLRIEADRRGTMLADVNAHLTTWRGHQAADRFHPNDAGYRLLAEAFRPSCDGGVQPDAS